MRTRGAWLGARLGEAPRPCAEQGRSPAVLRATVPCRVSLRVRPAALATRKRVPRTAAVAAGVWMTKRPPRFAAGLTSLSISPCCSSKRTCWPDETVRRFNSTRRSIEPAPSRARLPSGNCSTALPRLPVRSRLPGISSMPAAAAWGVPYCPAAPTRRQRCRRLRDGAHPRHRDAQCGLAAARGGVAIGILLDAGPVGQSLRKREVMFHRLSPADLVAEFLRRRGSAQTAPKGGQAGTQAEAAAWRRCCPCAARRIALLWCPSDG